MKVVYAIVAAVLLIVCACLASATILVGTYAALVVLGGPWWVSLLLLPLVSYPLGAAAGTLGAVWIGDALWDDRPAG